MSESVKKPQYNPSIPSRIGRGVADSLSAAAVDFRNALRRARRLRLDYVVLPVEGPLPERDGPPRSFLERRLPLPPQPLSMQQLNDRLRAVADADNARGVIFIFRGFTAGAATIQNFRSAVARLRAAGKEAIVYTPYLDLTHYYAATAADRIVAPPGARFEVLGLYSEVLFLKDTLARVGLSADVLQISPYKTAFDRFSQSDMTAEGREQLSWLVDDMYDVLTADMARDRGLEQSALQGIIDNAPYSAEEAHELGLIDAIRYDDELAGWLGDGVKSASLKTWDKARRVMTQRARPRPRRKVGVVSLNGLIVMGSSRKPPIKLPIPLVGDESAGEQTLVGLLRRLEKRRDIAALVFHVDSGGGSALASDLIGRQIERMAARIPVVVYMGVTAASGGYYVSAPANYIMSQRSTLTGSIGVITAKITTAGLLERLSINPVSIQRGQHAGLNHDREPWSAAEREVAGRAVVEIYEQFREVVMKGRGLSAEQVDEVGLGRVWTGRQALERGLVDGHGDFLDAIGKAADLAELPIDDLYAIPVTNFFARASAYVLPDASGEKALQELGRLLAGEQLSALSGRPLALLPYSVRFR